MGARRTNVVVNVSDSKLDLSTKRIRGYSAGLSLPRITVEILAPAVKSALALVNLAFRHRVNTRPTVARHEIATRLLLADEMHHMDLLKSRA
ncbi:hypothetical protein EVAR_33737_1 [Eumeta japonica]|uniref:Uncharacterized protein n=1 Tax=Eumeta variegata TaxID=151549 RepID=A0A4C1VRJ3_EUMVA|nr:hypothetical protein EVAR_33737_1 [Eumeta japonica]